MPSRASYSCRTRHTLGLEAGVDETGRWPALYDGDGDPESQTRALGAAMAFHHSCTAQHCEDVTALAGEVGRALGLNPAVIAELEMSARLHDVGKIAVPHSILDKAEPLTKGEWRVLRRHSAWGASILRRTPGLERVAAYVRSHHERWDGTGYPDGLKGREIPLPSRILGACDAYRAMTEDRPYRRALEPPEVLEELRAGAGGQFDPQVAVVLVEGMQDGLLRREGLSQAALLA